MNYNFDLVKDAIHIDRPNGHDPIDTNSNLNLVETVVPNNSAKPNAQGTNVENDNLDSVETVITNNTDRPNPDVQEKKPL